MNFSIFNCSPMRFLRYTLAVVLLSFFSTGSWAAWCTGGGGATYPITGLPTTVAVARNIPAGQPLTGWASTSLSTLYTNCSSTSSGAGTAFGPMSGMTSSGVTYTESGTTYTLWNSGVQGIGVAIRVSGQVTGGVCSVDGTTYSGDLSVAGGSLITGSIIVPGWRTEGCQYQSGGFNLYGQVAVKLVSTGATVQPGTTSTIQVIGAGYANGAINTTNAYNYFSLAPVGITVLTCTTPDVNVPMGTFKTTDFPNVGSLSPGTAAAVNIQVQNCPGTTGNSSDIAGTQAGMIHTVYYQIVPSATAQVKNVAPLSSDSTASGVGIQLFDSSGAVFPLSTQKSLVGYSSAAGGTYPINLTARYYRTGTVTPGTANATMTLIMSYQ
jgi:major type 1 subunit fimbrin (pilin)